MTVHDVASYLKCHSATVYRLLRKGEIQGFRVNSALRFRRADIDAFIAAGMVGSPEDVK